MHNWLIDTCGRCCGVLWHLEDPAGCLSLCLPPLGVGFLSICWPAGVLAGVWLERGGSTIDPNQECPPRFTVYEKGVVMTMIGIDPHKATHTAVAVDDDDVIDELTLEASSTQVECLCDWAGGLG